MIEVTHVHKSYGRVHAVRGISLTIRPGHVTALLGPNGAGKTTTIRMIVGTLAPDRGKVQIEGIPHPARSARARRQIGYLPENATAYPEMTPDEYLRHRAALYGIPKRDRRAALERAITDTGLLRMRRRPVSKLSKGYKQRVGLAAALIHDPKVLILDEPTNGLDPTQLGEIRSLITSLAQQRTVVLCSHVLAEVERLCDRVLIIASGKLVADVKPSATGRGCSVIAEIKGEPGAAADVLSQLRARPESPRVESYQLGGDRVQLVVGGLEREAVAQALHASGAVVYELRDDKPDLETLFMKAVNMESLEAPE